LRTILLSILLKNLEKQGFEISWLKVDPKGNMEPNEISPLIRKDTILITVTSASNEIGMLEPVKEIGRIARERGIIFHTDAVACVGFIEMDVNELNVDLLSMAGNVFYGPLGTGALYIKRGVRVLPLIEGGYSRKETSSRNSQYCRFSGDGYGCKNC